jgi:hypothetical protein
MTTLPLGKKILNSALSATLKKLKNNIHNSKEKVSGNFSGCCNSLGTYIIQIVYLFISFTFIVGITQE